MSKRKRDPPQATKSRYSKLDVIEKLLKPKIEGKVIADEGVKVFVKNIYATAPQYLNWNPIPELYDNERYYFVKRIPVSGKVKDPKNAKRTVDSENGYWRKSNCKEIMNGQDVIIGRDSLLNFKEYTDGTRKTSIKTRFLMHEYSLNNPGFQEWVVCKVEYKVEKNAVQQQPTIPLSPLPETIQREFFSSDQFVDDERTVISGDIVESNLGGGYDSITTTANMNMNEYEAHSEGQQQEASVESQSEDTDQWTVDWKQCDQYFADDHSSGDEPSMSYEDMTESPLDGRLNPQLDGYESITTIDEYETSELSQLKEEYNFNSGPLISQYQPQPCESIASNLMSIEEHQQEEEADSGFTLSPMPLHLVLEESQTSSHEDWIDTFIIFCLSDTS